MPTTDIEPAVLHNLVGWDILTADGWQTIREARSRGLGDKLVTTDETEPGREWVFGGRKVQVRAPRQAVELVCGHHGVAGTGRGRRQDHGFCWFGCFSTRPLASKMSQTKYRVEERRLLPDGGYRQQPVIETTERAHAEQAYTDELDLRADLYTPEGGYQLVMRTITPRSPRATSPFRS